MPDIKTLRVGVLAPVSTLDPREAQDFTSALAVMQVYESPFAQPAAVGGQPEPLLFQEKLRRESSTGLPVYTAAVRAGIFFSDGTPLKARHIADSLEKAASLREQADIEVQGERLVFRLKRPNAHFDMALARRFCGVTLESGLESGGAVLGTGPYMPGTRDGMRLVRNPYSRKPPAIDEIAFEVYPPDAQGRPSALLAALEAGEVDFTNVLSREDIMQLKNVRRWTEPGSSTAILYMNTERPALADPRVRKAIALSIDRLEIAKMFYASALAFAATSLLPPMLARGNDGLNPDLAQARALLSQTGVRKPDRLSLLLIYGPRPYLPNPRKVGEHLAERIGQLGIQVDLVPTATTQDYYSRTKRGDYDLALAGWIADTLDPVDFLEATINSESIPSPTRKINVGANLSRWHSRDADDALSRLREDPRDDLRAALLKRISDEVPLFPLLYGATIYAHAWKLKNLVPSPLGKPYFADLDL
jgi:ABC-type transport system substrate-binding protein